MKRHRSPDAEGGGSSRPKLPKTSSGSTATRAENDQLSENHQELDISVTLRSASKAARNDPRPPLSFADWQRIHQTGLETGVSGGDPSSSQAVGDTENPHGPDPARASSAAAELGLADGQQSAQHCSPVAPAPTANSRQPSREGSLDRSNKDDNSGLDDGHSHESDKDEDDSDDEDGSDDENGIEDMDGNEDEDGSEDLDDYDSDDGFPWYEELDGRATLKPSMDTPAVSCGEKEQIGGCNAKLIRRGKMRESFWLEMEQPIQETSDLAFDLFDRYGRLNPEFYKHDVNKGTGVWGNELDRGDLLLFEDLRVDSAYRRRGIGTKLVNAILEKTRQKVSESLGFFAVARPEFLWSEISPETRENPAAMKEAVQAALKPALGFWHALGFRRVGTSSWLAWTDSPGHPSRQLGIAQDWVDPDDLAADVSLSDEVEQTFQKLADPVAGAAECIDELTKTFPEDFQDGQWQTVDEDGNTLLHIASVSSKPELVKFLLSRVPRLAVMRNKKGHTALEALQNQLERYRTRRPVGLATCVTSDAFKGFDASDIECLAVLEHTTAFDLSSLTPREIEDIWSATDEQIRRAAPELDVAGIRKTLRYKYGCTCGQCIGGFISPRMKLALICVAELEHDQMHTFMDDTGPDWVATNSDVLTHLPPRVRENLKTNKSMREGFANMFSHFAKCLEQGRMPTEGEILDLYQFHVSEWPPVTRNYLQRGGSVAAAANMIFERALEQDEWAGDGSHREIFGEDIDKLVICRNDHEFGFVAGMCGYKRVKPGSSTFVDMFGRELALV